ncbi:unnamed protein product [Acanthosepion pharaonis]|uniref:Retropepsins domain-containing protein n=1 Tax=Acanthosepion pharaonis TaxID=158019 RepID=A0A812ER06_ACAPH|nr:unnamed protein product [Sepia pharaonis]
MWGKGKNYSTSLPLWRKGLPTAQPFSVMRSLSPVSFLVGLSRLSCSAAIRNGRLRVLTHVTTMCRPIAVSPVWPLPSRSTVCLLRREQPTEPSTTTLLSLQRFRPCSTGLLGKRVRGQGAVATLAPSRSINAALPVVNVYVEGKRCSALVDTGCSRSIVSADRCVTWSSQQIEIRTIDGVSRACCGVGTVSILTDGGNHAKVDVLVARQRPLGYDLLLGIDAIRALGGMIITPAVNVELDKGRKVCAALCISEPDFDVSFNSDERVWTGRRSVLSSLCLSIYIFLSYDSINDKTLCPSFSLSLPRPLSLVRLHK